MRRGATVGLIPARAGSKGVPGKNIKPLCGRPLIGYSIASALHSKCLDRVVVSTDNQGIANIARQLGAETPFLRPARYAGDGSPAIDVIRHAVCTLEELYAMVIHRVVYLQPTSPLRTSAHIDAAVALFDAAHADSVVSVVKVPHAYTAESQFELDRGQRLKQAPAETMQRRQDKPVRFARNGPAVLVISRECIEQGRLYGERTFALEMRTEESVDIDSDFDFMVAELLIRRRQQTTSGEYRTS